jgi:transcription termination factor Rho
VTETTEATTPAKRRSGGLSGMLLPELKQVASGLGIKGAGGMRKSQLVDAIKAAQSGTTGQGSDQSSGRPATKAASAPAAGDAAETATSTSTTSGGTSTTSAPSEQAQSQARRSSATDTRRDDRADDRADVQRDGQASAGSTGQDAAPDRASTDRAAERADARNDRDSRGDRNDRDRGDRSDREDRGERNRSRNRNQDGDREDTRGDRDNRGDRTDNRDDNRDNRDGDRDSRNQGGSGQHRNQGGGSGNRGYDDDQAGGRRNRRRRGRDRDRTTTSGSFRERERAPRRDEAEPQINEDDILVPAAGILDVLDNYAFVRTSGYLPGPNDVYVSLSMVRKYGLRKGDAITGTVRQAGEHDRKEKFNPLVRLESVNGADVESAKKRVDFSKLTPLYAADRLRLETESNILITRVIDIVAPIGKGQRGLIVSPPKAGKTMVLQAIANAITTNNPETHLMVVLVDERPEEVTDMQRTVKGEVIASTFDRPADDHTTVAELAIERAKRLVELGHDVVVLLDSITRLGRAYNLAAPASGRILSGGVDSSALYPPKRFFGAARNIEDGGSLTILATALVETGSKMDEVIFEEFKGTGNMELRLRREFADKRIFPAIDVIASGTRREELLMSKEEISIVWKLRRVLSGLDGQQALELLLERLKKSHSNVEFLMQVQKTMPTAGNGKSEG